MSARAEGVGGDPVAAGHGTAGEGRAYRLRFLALRVPELQSLGVTMGARGPAPKPVFQLIREGNPGHQAIPESVMLAPEDLDEPDWLESFPTVPDVELQKVNRRAREVARREWRRVAPVLKLKAGLAEVDTEIVRDYCICVARIDQCERDISTRGMIIEGERGWMKNGSTTVVSQYRSQLKTYIRELGLSPSARASIPPPAKDGDDDGDPFD
jgi:P27 family predicted phage terminase small subunit